MDSLTPVLKYFGHPGGTGQECLSYREWTPSAVGALVQTDTLQYGGGNLEELVSDLYLGRLGYGNLAYVPRFERM